MTDDLALPLPVRVTAVPPSSLLAAWDYSGEKAVFAGYVDYTSKIPRPLAIYEFKNKKQSKSSQ